MCYMSGRLEYRYMYMEIAVILNNNYGYFSCYILLHENFLQFDWVRIVVFQLNLKYLHVKSTNLLHLVV